MKKLTLLGMAVLLATVACACKGSQMETDRSAISASIDRHLQGRSDLNIGIMNHQLKQVSIQGDQATAQVEFWLKQGGASMMVDYTLARQNGQWVVTNSEPAGGHPAVNPSDSASPQGGAQGSMPSFRDLLQNPPGPTGKPLPPGHPAIGGSGSAGSGNSGGMGTAETQSSGSSY